MNEDIKEKISTWLRINEWGKELEIYCYETGKKPFATLKLISSSGFTVVGLMDKTKDCIIGIFQVDIDNPDKTAEEITEVIGKHLAKHYPDKKVSRMEAKRAW